jgi:hypothetical protein
MSNKLDAAIGAPVDALAELPEHEREWWQCGNRLGLRIYCSALPRHHAADGPGSPQVGLSALPAPPAAPPLAGQGGATPLGGRPRQQARSPLSFSVAGLGCAPLPLPLSGRVSRVAKAAVDLSPFTWRHLFRFAERLIVVGIGSMPRSSLGKRGLPRIAGSAFSAMNSNTLVGLVLKNPEIHAQPPLSSPCQNDANRNKSDRPHATHSHGSLLSGPINASDSASCFLSHWRGWPWPLWPLPRLKIRRLRTTRW